MDEAPDAVLLTDEPLPRVRRLTLNRPHKRSFKEKGVRANLSERDRAFGDYRETDEVSS